MSRFYPGITQEALTALRLCQHLESFTWMDDSFTGGRILLYFLDVIRTLPLKELIIRSSCDLGEDAWIQLNKLTGLRKVVIWCMDGPPRVLQGWAENLGETLTHLNLGVSSPLLWSNGLVDLYYFNVTEMCRRPNNYPNFSTVPIAPPSRITAERRTLRCNTYTIDVPPKLSHPRHRIPRFRKLWTT
jgi:hypothetical protein